MTALLADKGLDKTNKLFKNQSLLDEHYGKHGQEIADVLGDSNYSIDKYLDDANYIINNGKRQTMRQSLKSTPPIIGDVASCIRPEDYLTMA